MFQTCSTFFGHLETAICTISLAANFGNLYRLPQMIFSSGDEVPFLIVYTILSLFIGFPLLVLELGIGQIAQEGFVKMWRAVPFFKGNDITKKRQRLINNEFFKRQFNPLTTFFQPQNCMFLLNQYQS